MNTVAPLDKNVVDAIIDFESLGYAPECILVDCSVLCFNHNPYIKPNFMKMVKQGKRFKFNIKMQPDRIADEHTLQWWKDRDPAAKRNLAPTPSDIVDVYQLPGLLQQYLDEHGFDKKTGQMWCRGMSFDFPILIDLLRKKFNTRNTFDYEPCFFWNQRDVRTAVEATLLMRDRTTCPLPMGALEGFVHHDSVHDCAKAAMDLLYSKRYALGLEDFPENPDPLSLSR